MYQTKSTAQEKAAHIKKQEPEQRVQEIPKKKKQRRRRKQKIGTQKLKKQAE